MSLFWNVPRQPALRRIMQDQLIITINSELEGRLPPYSLCDQGRYSVGRQRFISQFTHAVIQMWVWTQQYRESLSQHCHARPQSLRVSQSTWVQRVSMQRLPSLCSVEPNRMVCRRSVVYYPCPCPFCSLWLGIAVRTTRSKMIYVSSTLSSVLDCYRIWHEWSSRPTILVLAQSPWHTRRKFTPGESVSPGVNFLSCPFRSWVSFIWVCFLWTFPCRLGCRRPAYRSNHPLI